MVNGRNAVDMSSKEHRINQKVDAQRQVKYSTCSVRLGIVCWYRFML